MLRFKNNDKKNGNFTNLYKKFSWQKTINNDALLANIIKGIEEVKGNDIDILDLREIDTAVCDYFRYLQRKFKHTS
jgi:hypothetical protein